MLDLFKLFLEFCLFAFAIIFYWYIPSLYLFSRFKLKLEYPANIFLPFVTGAIFFTLEIYFLSWLRFPFLIFPVTVVFFIFSLRKKLLSFPKIPKNHKNVTLLIILFAIIFSLQMVFNGNFGNSIYWFGDDLAHLAYISELKHVFPPNHPGFSEIPLRGYHFFNDFLIASLSNYSFISSFSLYFHFLPLFVAFGWAFGAYSILFLWTKKISVSLFGTFLTLFGSSFYFLLYFVNKSSFFSHLSFGIDQPATALLNAPYAFSVAIIFAVLLCMQMYLNKSNIFLLFCIAVLVGISPMFKVYGGIILISGFAVFSLICFFKKDYKILYAGFLALLIFVLTFAVFSGKGSGLFYFPLWPIERVMDNFFSEYGYKEKIDTFTKLGVIKGLLETHIYSISIFLIGNLGTRFFGIILLCLFFLKRKKPSYFSFIIFTIIIVSAIFPMFFAQTIKVFEMIQMTWYYPVLVSLPAALGFSYLFNSSINRYIRYPVLFLIIVFTILGTVKTYQIIAMPLLNVKRQSLQNEYFLAMEYFKTHGNYEDTVFTIPLDPSFKNIEKLEKDWFNGSSADIAAFGNKRMYIGNQYIVFPNMPVRERLIFLAKINELEFSKNFNKKEINDIKNKIKKENIKYIYTIRPLKIFNNNPYFSLVFKNNTGVIYKVD